MSRQCDVLQGRGGTHTPDPGRKDYISRNYPEVDEPGSPGVSSVDTSVGSPGTRIWWRTERRQRSRSRETGDVTQRPKSSNLRGVFSQTTKGPTGPTCRSQFSVCSRWVPVPLTHQVSGTLVYGLRSESTTANEGRSPLSPT